MKHTIILICLTLFMAVPVFGQAPSLPAELGPHQWTVTVKVMSEGGGPIAGAEVAVFYNVTGAGPHQPRFGEVKGTTDQNGFFSTSHTDSSSGLAITVNKSGYYTTHLGHQFYYDEKRRNPFFETVLKSVGKPIAMYAKSITHLKFPVLNKPIGYDLIIGDWVAPYGKGLDSDFLFCENHVDAKSGYTFTVNFPNNGDGIQSFDAPFMLQDAKTGQSDFKSLHEAPIEGYQTNYVQTKGPVQDRNYYFRVRTILNPDGSVKSALYGKIYGDFMEFKYYLNPTPNDRNIEFDAKHNLISGLTSLEEVSAP